MTSKNITVLTTSYPTSNQPEAGWFVEDECIALDNSGFKVKVICPESNQVLLSNKFPVYRFRYSIFKKERIAYGSGMGANIKKSILAKLQLPLFFISFFFKAYRISSKKDILYCHWSPSLLIGVLIKKIRGNKLVFMTHHFHNKTFIYKWLLSNIDVLLSNSSVNENHTLKIFPVKKHFINHIGVNENTYIPDESKKQTNTIELLSVGRLIPIKGHRMLLNSVLELRNKYHFKLTIIGDGPLKIEYNKFIKKHNLDDFVKIIGPIKKQDVIEYYQKSNLLIMPSLDNNKDGKEGLGTVIIEAAMCNLPVIASNSGGIPDIINKCKNGLLFPANNQNKLTLAIETFLKDPSLFNVNDIRTLTMDFFGKEVLNKKLISIFNSID